MAVARQWSLSPNLHPCFLDNCTRIVLQTSRLTYSSLIFPAHSPLSSFFFIFSLLLNSSILISSSINFPPCFLNRSWWHVITRHKWLPKRWFVFPWKQRERLNFQMFSKEKIALRCCDGSNRIGKKIEVLWMLMHQKRVRKTKRITNSILLHK